MSAGTRGMRPSEAALPMRRVHFVLYLYGTLLCLLLLPSLLTWQPFGVSPATEAEARAWVGLNRVLYALHAGFLLWILADLRGAWREPGRGRVRAVAECLLALMLLLLLNSLTLFPYLLSHAALAIAGD